MKGVGFSSRVRERVICDVAKGGDIQEVAVLHGVNYVTVYRWVNHLGLARAKKSLTPDEVDYVRSAYNEGDDIDALAKEMGCSEHTIVRRLAGHRNRVRGRPRDSIPKDEAVAMHLEGANMAKIGQRFGVHPDTARRVLRDAGVWKKRDCA